MSKMKMRCPKCNKQFRPSDSRQTLCPDCLAKERQARARGAPQTAKAAQPVKAPTPAPLIVAAPPPDTGAFGSAARRAEEERRQHPHGPPPHPPHPEHSGPGVSQPRHEASVASHQLGMSVKHGAQPGAGAQSGPGTAKAPGAAKPPRAPKAAKPHKERVVLPPRTLTEFEREQVEQLYMQLAHPREYDGIRTQIASRLDLPRPLVRKAVYDLRARMGLPSWWDLQAFPGSATDLERIRAAYEPLLPVPPVGVHKQIAEQLGLEPHAVYKGIRQLRAQMGLPQFNPPEQHPEHVMSGAVRPAAATPQADTMQDTST